MLLEPNRMPCQDLIDVLVNLGMHALYVTDASYESGITALDKNTVLIYTHDRGEDVILMGDNEIDVVRFKFGPSRNSVRGS